MKGESEKSDLSFLSQKNEIKEQTSSGTKKLVFAVFLLFLLFFPLYSPWASIDYDTNPPSLARSIFDLYFFITSQTLGIVHEAGHGVCYVLPCPRFFMVLNGTLFQVAFPLIIAAYYAKRKNNTGKYIGIFFGGFSLQYTAWYISTAHEGAIVPASRSFLGVDSYHDFHYILNTLGLLSYDSIISFLVKTTAYFIMCYSVFGLFKEAFTETENNGSGKRAAR